MSSIQKKYPRLKKVTHGLVKDDLKSALLEAGLLAENPLDEDAAKFEIAAEAMRKAFENYKERFLSGSDRAKENRILLELLSRHESHNNQVSLLSEELADFLLKLFQTPENAMKWLKSKPVPLENKSPMQLIPDFNDDVLDELYALAEGVHS